MKYLSVIYLILYDGKMRNLRINIKLLVNLRICIIRAIFHIFQIHIQIGSSDTTRVFLFYFEIMKSVTRVTSVNYEYATEKSGDVKLRIFIFVF